MFTAALAWRLSPVLTSVILHLDLRLLHMFVEYIYGRLSFVSSIHKEYPDFKCIFVLQRNA